jgi:hypothetical protein
MIIIYLNDCHIWNLMQLEGTIYFRCESFNGRRKEAEDITIWQKKRKAGPGRWVEFLIYNRSEKKVTQYSSCYYHLTL